MAAFISNFCRIRDHMIIGPAGLLFTHESKSLDEFLAAAYDWLKPAYPKFYKMDNMSKLGFLATEILVKDVKLQENYSPEAIAVVTANSYASLDTDVKYNASLETIASPALFVYTLSNIVCGEICIRHGIKGENACFVAEVFDPLTLSQYVDMVLSKAKTKICIAGWVDVMDGHHDVFLYLSENRKGENSLEHSVNVLADLYKK
jgi:hypothetical protein